MYKVEYEISFSAISAHGKEETIRSEKFFDNFVQALAFAHDVNGEVVVEENR